MAQYLIQECKKTGAIISEDKAGNILARKGEPSICLQSHYDMVCMGKAPQIETYEEDGFLYAKDSSLGADNGMGIAIMLEILATQENLECLFTNDEEVGLLGAEELGLEVKSPYLLNLDSEDEGIVYVGCAGGIELKASMTIQKEKIPEDYELFEIKVLDLPGGHSGIQIAEPIPNAIIMLANALRKYNALLIQIQGGERINSIPSHAQAIVALPRGCNFNDPTIFSTPLRRKISHYIYNSKQILNFLCAFPHGVLGWDMALNVPSKSSNLARIFGDKDSLHVEIFARAMDKKGLKALQNNHEALLDLGGFTVHYHHENAPWTPQPFDFAQKVKEEAERIWGPTQLGAIHAGLEPGLLTQKLPHLHEACSIGPRIEAPHTIKERCEIASVGRVAQIVLSLIKRMQDVTC
jgi:dipeptidase D